MSILVAAPELNLSESEAKEYAESVAMVARHYDVGASAKTLDWFNLATTMASIYGVRAIAIAARKKGERQGAAGPAIVMPNGHDSPPAAPTAAEPGDGGPIDWSSMTGQRGRPN